ncbi:MAG: glycosyltransferase family 2 protein [Candidatus Staskawiczbacteria bacterium]|nr:glycosyltransferase family 2 protein [Candidatus Staskawiczbacteria bacterium]
MNQTPLISICIPTYKRSGYLEKCLDNLAHQLEDSVVKNAVEIVISDNASPDNTREVVQKFQAKFDNINYFCNETNIGMDGNIMHSITRATGQYCWNIGDDDIIQNGALARAVTILTEKEVALLTVDFYPYVDIEKSMKNTPILQQPIYETNAETFYDKGYYQGIFGIAIFKKAEWLKIPRENLEPYWGYYEIILKMIGTATLPLAYTASPLVYIGQDYRWNNGGVALAVRIHCKRMLEKLSGFGYSQAFVKKEIDILARSLPLTIMSAKSFSLPCTKENLTLMWREFSYYPLQLILATIIFFIPNFFIKILKSLKQLFNGSNRI